MLKLGYAMIIVPILCLMVYLFCVDIDTLIFVLGALSVTVGIGLVLDKTNY